MRVAFTGSRTWTDAAMIKRDMQRMLFLSKLRGEPLVIIHGACPTGADKMVDGVAKSLGLTPVPYPAAWTLYGKRAGFIRNRFMLEDSKPDLLVAYFNPSDLDRRRSTGTLDAIKSAQALYIPVRFCTPEG